jgi:hypothetical protein
VIHKFFNENTNKLLIYKLFFGFYLIKITIISLYSVEGGFTGLAKNPEFAAAIQKSFANQVSSSQPDPDHCVTHNIYRL